MDGFPSGQRGQTVNLLQIASVVRIHLHPVEYRKGSKQTDRLITNQLSEYADVAQLAEQLICNQQVIGSSPIIGLDNLIIIIMDGFPSGQRGQTVNLLQIASVVRIHLHPFAIGDLQFNNYRGVEQSGSSSGS